MSNLTAKLSPVSTLIHRYNKVIYNYTKHINICQRIHTARIVRQTVVQSNPVPSVPTTGLLLSTHLPQHNQNTTQPIQTAQFAASMQQLKLNTTDSIAVALSGGSDSTALTLLLNDWFHTYAEVNETSRGKLLAVCINHKQRAESVDEIKYCNEWLTARGIEYVNVDLHGTENSTQEQLRQYRYQLLTDICIQHNIQYIATGHQQDDQIETLLLRLYRATGLNGLIGIRPSQIMTANNTITMIRPLLQYTKQQCEATCIHYNQPWCIDRSNGTDIYDRNRIRAAIQEFHHITHDQLVQLSDTMIQIGHFAEQQIQELVKKYTDTYTQHKQTYTVFNVYQCISLHPTILSAMIQHIVDTLTTTVRLNNAAINTFVTELQNNKLNTTNRYVIGNCVITILTRKAQLKLRFNVTNRNAAVNHNPDTADKQHTEVKPLTSEQLSKLLSRITKVHPLTNTLYARITVLVDTLLLHSNDTVSTVLQRLLVLCVPTKSLSIKSIDRYIVDLRHDRIPYNRNVLLGNCMVRSSIAKNNKNLLYISPRRELLRINEESNMNVAASNK